MSHEHEAGWECPRCLAPLARQFADECDRCGADLRVGAHLDEAESEARQLENRFQGLAKDPRLPELLRREPGAPWISLQILVGLVVLIAVLSAVVSVVTRATEAPPWVSAAALVLLATLVPFWVRWLGALNRYFHAELERNLGLILERKVAPTPRRAGRVAAVSLRVTLALPDGSQRDLITHANLASRLPTGARGVAYVRDDYLLDFVDLSASDMFDELE